jgi:gas vesicle protein
MRTGKALLGVLAGMAAGAALGLLFAPGKGSETCKKVSRKGEDLAEALNDRIDEKFDELMSAITGTTGKPERQREYKAQKEDLAG